jgi:hypothetical protein
VRAGLEVGVKAPEAAPAHPLAALAAATGGICCPLGMGHAFNSLKDMLPELIASFFWGYAALAQPGHLAAGGRPEPVSQRPTTLAFDLATCARHGTHLTPLTRHHFTISMGLPAADNRTPPYAERTTSSLLEQVCKVQVAAAGHCRMACTLPALAHLRFRLGLPCRC